MISESEARCTDVATRKEKIDGAVTGGRSKPSGARGWLSSIEGQDFGKAEEGGETPWRVLQERACQKIKRWKKSEDKDKGQAQREDEGKGESIAEKEV